jgi:hypothetical protein
MNAQFGILLDFKSIDNSGTKPSGPGMTCASFLRRFYSPADQFLAHTPIWSRDDFSYERKTVG